jgi:hypothetical protein
MPMLRYKLSVPSSNQTTHEDGTDSMTRKSVKLPFYSAQNPPLHLKTQWIQSLVTLAAEVKQRATVSPFQRAWRLFPVPPCWNKASRASVRYSSHDKSLHLLINSSWGMFCWSMSVCVIDMFHIQHTTFIWIYEHKIQ